MRSRTEGLGRVGLGVMLLWIGMLSMAAEDENTTASLTAHAVMEVTTSRVMTILAEAESYHKQDPERFYEQIHSVLDELVDFEGFARGVMGRYASSTRYQSMDAGQQMKFREQVSRFSSVIRIGLVRTYGKGLLAFNGSEVKILPPAEGEDGASDSTTVVQHIFSSAADPYVIRYSMRRNSAGAWRMRNMIVESINLGQIYRNQFEAAMHDHRGNIDRVIDSWDVDTAEAESKPDLQVGTADQAN